jgi:hypothetical protein
MKAIIIEHAQSGAFNHTPLLSTAHTIACPRCHHRQTIVYLDALKRGAFEVGKAERIEMLDASGPMGIVEMEQMTPLIISLTCTGCGNRMEVRPVNVEYLSILLDRPRPSGAMYA